MSAPAGDIKEAIRRYVPGTRADNARHGFERLVIMLLGFTAHGKSSLINSCICVMKDEVYRNVAGAGKDEEGRTKKRISHQLTDTIWITDNRGFCKMKPEEVLEVSAQLRHLRVEEDVEWKEDNLQETIRCIPKVNSQPKEFLLPVIVHSGIHSTIGGEEKSMVTLVKLCQEIIKIPPVVVITRAGLNNRSEGVAIAERKFGEMGCTHRICLENYTENNQTQSPEADDQFLRFLDVCIKEAEYGIKRRANLNPYEVIASHMANQVKEESELERRKWTEQKNNMMREKDHLKEELEKERKKVSDLEKKLQEKKCSLL